MELPDAWLADRSFLVSCHPVDANATRATAWLSRTNVSLHQTGDSFCAAPYAWSVPQLADGAVQSVPSS